MSYNKFVAHANVLPRSQAGYMPGLGEYGVPSFLSRNNHSISGEFPTVPIHSSSSSISPAEERQALKTSAATIAAQLLSMCGEAIRLPSGADWLSFWAENYEEFVRLADSLRPLLRRIGLSEDALERNARSNEQKILTAFPEAEDELRFLFSMMRRAHKSVMRFKKKPIAGHSRDADAALAADFNFWTRWFAICMTQLSLVAIADDIQLESELKAQIFEIARHSAFQVNHASMEAANLRRSLSSDLEKTEPSSERTQIEDGDLVDVERAICRFEAIG